MRYGVISQTEVGWLCGIDRDGTRQLMPERIELMTREDAEATAAKHGGVVVSDRLFPADWNEANAYAAI